jgi:hypothetical protein
VTRWVAVRWARGGLAGVQGLGLRRCNQTDEGTGEASRYLMPYADHVDADADDDDSSDEVGGCVLGAGWFGRGSGFRRHHYMSAGAAAGPADRSCRMQEMQTTYMQTHDDESNGDDVGGCSGGRGVGGLGFRRCHQTDEGRGGASRHLMPYADSVDADADNDSSSDEVGGCVVGKGVASGR